MLCSKTKFFRSVLVVILALSLVGGLVVFKGFSIDKNEGSSEGSSVVTKILEKSLPESEETEEGKNDSNVNAEENSTKPEEVGESSNNTGKTEDNGENAAVEKSADNEGPGRVIKTYAIYNNTGCTPGECPEKPIFINSADDLIVFFEDLKEGNTFRGKYIEIGNDIMITRDQSKIFVETLKETGVLFPGEFGGYLKGNGYVIFVEFEEEKPADLRYLFEQASENAAVILVNVIFSAQQASNVYTFNSFAQVN